MSEILGKLPNKSGLGGRGLESFPPIQNLVGKRTDEILAILEVADGPFKKCFVSSICGLILAQVNSQADDTTQLGSFQTL